MFLVHNTIQVLCGALAGETAREGTEHGAFTAALVAALSAPHDPPLLALPLDLQAWHDALPGNLLAAGVQILDHRDVVGAAPPAAHDVADAGAPQIEQHAEIGPPPDDTGRRDVGGDGPPDAPPHQTATAS